MQALPSTKFDTENSIFDGSTRETKGKQAKQPSPDGSGT
jgi:hypothetical protein